eukprot:10868866-Lingulodinium_polyedra.AAC.1
MPNMCRWLPRPLSPRVGHVFAPPKLAKKPKWVVKPPAPERGTTIRDGPRATPGPAHARTTTNELCIRP